MNCPSCGKKYQLVSELNDVGQIGLALKGTCIGCGTRFGINELWRVTKEVDLIGDCLYCGERIERNSQGRDRGYCSTRCKQAGYRKRRKSVTRQKSVTK